MVELLFTSPASEVTTDLVFGATDTLPGDTTVVVQAHIPLEVSVKLAMSSPMTVQVVLPLEVHVNAKYVSGASRPTVGQATGRYQTADPLHIGLRHRSSAALAVRPGVRVTFEKAASARSGVRIHNQRGVGLANRVGLRHQVAAPRSNRSVLRHQEGVKVRSEVTGRHQDGEAAFYGLTLRYQDGLRDRRNQTSARWQDGTRRGRAVTGAAGTALPITAATSERHQQARRPPPGIWDHVIVVPPGEPCYAPSTHLVFSAPWVASTHLVFACDGHGGEVPPPGVVVPVRRVYMIINDTSLWRVNGMLEVRGVSMSMSLDSDSWAWSFSASLPGASLALVQPDSSGDPVELEARVNGTAYRFLAESIGRERTFESSRVTVRGRSKSAWLDAPYAPVQTFSASAARTAQQLMADVLTQNGVGIGWDIDWQLEDWLVPGGAWSTQGAYIAALGQIAAAAGGYLQPHRTEQILRAVHRYPVSPWDWLTDVTPDFELPSAVTSREGIEWADKARYDRVWIAGAAGGVLGRVTRAGTAGELLAPMVSDPLMTHGDAVRQRGRAVLGDVGRQALVSLRLPVLEETGVIEPGKFVSYVDGEGTRLGIVRSTSVEVGSLEVWQSIGVETHV